MLFINLTKLPKKMAILFYLAFTSLHLLQQNVTFFVITVFTFHPHPLKNKLLNTLTNCQHKSKNLTKIIAVRISSQTFSNVEHVISVLLLLFSNTP